MIVNMRYIPDHFAATNEAFNSATTAVRVAANTVFETCGGNVEVIVKQMKDRPKLNVDFVLYTPAEEVLNMLLPLDIRHFLVQRFSSSLSSKPLIRSACAAAKCKHCRNELIFYQCYVCVCGVFNDLPSFHFRFCENGGGLGVVNVFRRPEQPGYRKY
jgi:hypothetical protein